MDIIDIKIKDQFDQIHDAKAQLKKNLVEHENESLKLSQRIEYIIVDNEVILPTTELLFESEQNEKIYRVIEE
ncbi:hypothetical protein [Acinetobacter baumannii]|uniref:Uncharacterized protein n=2 Tax=Acinetobacter baumannii TaxID=470 RepID=A0A505MBK4_ACIBA|nr:hypothetical protein [Acinetobacter baumannii]SSW78607.1 Uncharacterised protein [Klebsiella pneumoniae]ATI39049.1 hypothetical protein BS103_10780 [Acinetobacter baumannii]AVP34450.1 hypothetical protein C6W84_11005 [Acinetobacter baumannii]EHU3334385.1 hypothetical protein [Acinetobacter baumannii]EJB8433813.1 hypothetical protein [Acinetobacter baumannii]